MYVVWFGLDRFWKINPKYETIQLFLQKDVFECPFVKTDGSDFGLTFQNRSKPNQTANIYFNTYLSSISMIYCINLVGFKLF
jgi:hypothetical protein